MNAVGIDVSKGKSTVTIRQPGDVVVLPPRDYRHTQSSINDLIATIKELDGETKVCMSFLNFADIDFIGNMVRRYGDLVNSRETAMKVAGLVSAMDKNPLFEMRTDADTARVYDFVRIYTNIEKQAAENTEAEKKNLNDAEYGLVKTKPIYTHGIGGSNQYLRELETSAGLSLSWRRRGSTPVDGINGMVDVYDSRLPDGSEYKTLFINMYGTSNSEVIPKGFRKK